MTDPDMTVTLAEQNSKLAELAEHCSKLDTRLSAVEALIPGASKIPPHPAKLLGALDGEKLTRAIDEILRATLGAADRLSQADQARVRATVKGWLDARDANGAA